MPNYEYYCTDCNHIFEIFLTYQEYGSQTMDCPQCESTHIKRIIKPVRVARSEEARLEALGQMMRQMSRELGEDMGPEFDEVVNRLEKGQSPEDIERDLPDLGSDGGGLNPGLDL